MPLAINQENDARVKVESTDDKCPNVNIREILLFEPKVFGAVALGWRGVAERLNN